jgi:hypothetical protein
MPNGTHGGGGISADILNGLIALFERFWGPSHGVAQSFTTNGLGSATYKAGALYKILENVDRPIPALTISNTGSSSIKVGYGVPTFTVLGGASLTLRWKNPFRSHLVFTDLGVSGIVVEIIG